VESTQIVDAESWFGNEQMFFECCVLANLLRSLAIVVAL
jgi:hypothetical protein